MAIEQSKLDAYLQWNAANDAYVLEMRKIIGGQAACDNELMKKKAIELTRLFGEYRRAWQLE